MQRATLESWILWKIELQDSPFRETRESEMGN